MAWKGLRGGVLGRLGVGEEVGDYEGCGAGFAHCAGEDVSEAAWISGLGRRKQGMEMVMEDRREDIRRQLKS